MAKVEWKRMDLADAEPYYVLGLLPPEEVPTVASNEIMRGGDGEALLKLASLSCPTWRDIGTLVDRALGEIGVAKQTRVEAWSSVARHVLDGVEEGTISLRDAGYQLAMLATAAEYPEVLLPLQGLEDYLDLGLLTDQQWETALAKEMMELRARLDRGGGGNHLDEYGSGALYWVRRYGEASQRQT